MEKLLPKLKYDDLNGEGLTNGLLLKLKSCNKVKYFFKSDIWC